MNSFIKAIEYLISKSKITTTQKTNTTSKKIKGQLILMK